MPRKSTKVSDSAPSSPVPPPIENDIFADDVKWLKENSGNAGNTKQGGPVTLSQPPVASNIISDNQPVNYIESSSTDMNGYQTITTTTTTPNTLPVVQPVPVYQPSTTAPPVMIPAIPTYPTIPTIPSVPSIPNYENVNYNLMNNQTPAQQVYVNETSIWNIEWTIPTIRTVDANGVEIASYKDVVCSVRKYANDIYTVEQVSDTSRWVFAMIHTIMDAVRKHSHQINIDPNQKVNYLEIMDPGMLDIISSFRKRMLDKRFGYPRITVKCRYGFKMPESNVDVKIEAYEHTDPVEFYSDIMTSLEPMRRIENMHRKLEEQIIQNRKELFGNGQAPLPTAPVASSAPTTNYTSNPAPGYQQQAPTPQAPANTNPGTSEILDCRTDDDAQNAGFNTLLAYHATRVYRKDGKFNFYMPVGGSDQRARPKGIYAYEQGKGASPVIEQALRDGRLPPLQNGESTDYDVTIIALKLPTQSGAAKYEVKDIIRAAQ